MSIVKISRNKSFISTLVSYIKYCQKQNHNSDIIIVLPNSRLEKKLSYVLGKNNITNVNIKNFVDYASSILPNIISKEEEKKIIYQIVSEEFNTNLYDTIKLSNNFIKLINETAISGVNIDETINISAEEVSKIFSGNIEKIIKLNEIYREYLDHRHLIAFDQLLKKSSDHIIKSLESSNKTFIFAGFNSGSSKGQFKSLYNLFESIIESNRHIYFEYLGYNDYKKPIIYKFHDIYDEIRYVENLILSPDIDMNKTLAIISNNYEFRDLLYKSLKSKNIVIDRSEGINIRDFEIYRIFLLIIRVMSFGGKKLDVLALIKSRIYGLNIDEINELESNIFRKYRQINDIRTILQVNDICSSKFDILIDLSNSLLQLSFGKFGDFIGNAIEYIKKFELSEDDLNIIQTYIEPLKQYEFPINITELESNFELITSGIRIYNPFTTHPKIRILSTDEARLQRFDKVILCSANQNSLYNFSASSLINDYIRSKLGYITEYDYNKIIDEDIKTLIGSNEVVITYLEYINGTSASISGVLAYIRDKYSIEIENIYKETHNDNLANIINPFDLNLTPNLSNGFSISAYNIQKLYNMFLEEEQKFIDLYSIYLSDSMELRELDPIEYKFRLKDLGMLLNIISGYIHKNYNIKKYEEILVGIDKLTKSTLGNEIYNFLKPRLYNISNYLYSQEAKYSSMSNISLCHELGGAKIFSKLDKIEIEEDKVKIIDYILSDPPSKNSILNGANILLGLNAFLLHKSGSDILSISDKKISIKYIKLGSKEIIETDEIELSEEFLNKMENITTNVIEKYRLLLHNEANLTL